MTVLVLFAVEVTIGFEEIVYTTTEPDFGTTTLEVCMEVTRGAVGRELTVIPDVIENTAQSECGIN